MQALPGLPLSVPCSTTPESERHWYLTTTNLKDDGAILDEGTAATPQAACKAARQALLKERGIVYPDNRGNDSISALFRALVAEKLEEIRRQDDPQKLGGEMLDFKSVT